VETGQGQHRLPRRGRRRLLDGLCILHLLCESGYKLRRRLGRCVLVSLWSICSGTFEEIRGPAVMAIEVALHQPLTVPASRRRWIDAEFGREFPEGQEPLRAQALIPGRQPELLGEEMDLRPGERKAVAGPQPLRIQERGRLGLGMFVE
jgi:hypothetical protein